MAEKHTPDQFPQVDRIDLPVQALRTPLVAPDQAPSAADWAALQEQLVPLISTAIARKARQRRYAP